MPMDLRFSLPAAGVTALTAVLAVVRAMTAPAPAVPPPASAAVRAEIAAKLATQEREWQRQVSENFPQDNWSQSDDFHGLEYREVLKVAKERNVRVEDVLRAIDEDLHRVPAPGPNAPDSRAAHAVPCKPRPFYD